MIIISTFTEQFQWRMNFILAEFLKKFFFKSISSVDDYPTKWLAITLAFQKKIWIMRRQDGETVHRPAMSPVPAN